MGLNFRKKCKLKQSIGDYNEFSGSSFITESGAQSTDDIIIIPVVSKFLGVTKTLDRFCFSERQALSLCQLRFKMWALSHNITYRTLLIEIISGVRGQRQKPLYRLKQL